MTTFKKVLKQDINKLKKIPNFRPPPSLFSKKKADLDLLLGMNYAGLHPVDNLVVYKNILGCPRSNPYLPGVMVQ